MSLTMNNGEYLLRIARHLIINSSFESNIGLYNGKTGIVIFFAYYSRYTKQKIYYDFAIKLLEEVYAEIHTETPINFKNGLCGIGWSIEYLLKYAFLDGDSNEILVEIDNKIMECDPLRICDNCFDTGSAGILYYVLTRLISIKRNKDVIPFIPTYLDCWHEISLKKKESDTEMKYLCELFIKWKNNEEIVIDANRLLINKILANKLVIDEEFLYLPFGLKNGSAGIGLKYILL